jgi:hypothetical protein
VSNPTGIATSSTLVTLTDGGNNSLSAQLTRVDAPLQPGLSVVKFHGTIQIPPNLPTGVYTATSKPIVALNADGMPGFSTDTLYATSTTKLIGAEGSLLVRNRGQLNYNFPTFVGPAFNKSLGLTFVNPKFNSAPTPIWKVNEFFNPADYYELTVPNLNLQIRANTSSICTSDGKVLKLISVGACSFTVFTEQTSDYQYQKSDQTVNVSAARSKPVYQVGAIGTQSSTSLPLVIPGPFVYGPLGLVAPISATPGVCYSTGTYINVISGGTCTLNYSTGADSNYLASEIYPLTFQISRQTQYVSFSTVPRAKLSDKLISLTATSSSGRQVAFLSNTPSTCAISGNSVILRRVGSCEIVAVQPGSATVEPASTSQSIMILEASPFSKTLACTKRGNLKQTSSRKCLPNHPQ